MKKLGAAIFLFLLLLACPASAEGGSGQPIYYTLQLLHEGSFPAIEYLESYEGAAGVIRDGLLNRQEEIIVSAPDDDCAALAGLYQNVVNNSPRLSYVTGSVGIVQLDESHYQIIPRYEVTNAISLFSSPRANAAVREILAQVDDRMSDVEKMLAVHDYMLLHYEYDLTYSIYDAQEFFENKRGVCSAYASAFQWVMEELGIPCTIVTSDAMDHAWNLVRVKGNWYHIDVTWDDPVSDTYGRAWHDYFMLSDKAIGDSVHGHYDWDAPYPAKDTTYDTYPWTCAASPMQYYQGAWYWAQDTGQSCQVDGEEALFLEGGVYRYTFSDNTVTSLIPSYEFTTLHMNRGYCYAVSRDHNLYMAPVGAINAENMIRVSELTCLDQDGKLDGFYMEQGKLYYAYAEPEYYQMDGGQLKAKYPNYFTYRYSNSHDLSGYRYRKNLCGNQLTWELTDGVLRISGSGAIWNYPEESPWWEERNTIRAILIDKGVTRIGKRAFSGCTALTSVSIPEGVTEISSSGFSFCSGLKYLQLPRSLAEIGNSAFASCNNLKEVYYAGNTALQTAVKIGTRNDALTRAAITNNSTFPAPTISSVSSSVSAVVVCSFTATVQNVKSPCFLVVAGYTWDGKFLDAGYVPLWPDETEKTVALLGFGMNKGKIMIWDGMDSMIPLCEGVETRVPPR